MNIGNGGLNVSQSTGPSYQQEQHAHLAPGTDASHQLKLNQADAGAGVTGSFDKDGGEVKAGGSASWKALQDHADVTNKTTVMDGEKPLVSKNTVSSDATVGTEVHATAGAHANKDGVGGGFDVGGSAGANWSGKASTELNTVGDDGKEENLAGAEVGLDTHAGIAAGVKGGFNYDHGKLTTEFGVNLSPGAGAGFHVKLSANPENIAREGQKIAEEIGQKAGEAGYQAQKQMGETLSGIQKFLGGIHLFG